jgi:protein SCO1/2
MKNILIIKWALLLLTFSISAYAHTHQSEAVAEHQSDSLFNITDTWTTIDEKPLQMADLNTGPTVIAMIYTSCQDVCPLIVEDMKKIERRLIGRQSDTVRFAIFSMDPERDTIKKLKDYARAHGIDSSRWVVARGSPDAVRRLAVAIGMKYKKTKSGDFEHSKLISIIDESGVIKYQQSDIGLNGESAVNAISHLQH